jgi:hypothetical protein
MKRFVLLSISCSMILVALGFPASSKYTTGGQIKKARFTSTRTTTPKGDVVEGFAMSRPTAAGSTRAGSSTELAGIDGWVEICLSFWRNGEYTPTQKDLDRGVAVFNGGVYLLTGSFDRLPASSTQKIFSPVLHTQSMSYALTLLPRTTYQLPSEDTPNANLILWRPGEKHHYIVKGYAGPDLQLDDGTRVPSFSVLSISRDY